MYCLFRKLTAYGKQLTASKYRKAIALSEQRESKGFTLVELLVAISIIAVLSATGTTVYTNARNQALKAKRMADIDAIKKAYEKNFSAEANNGQGGYKPITTADFSSGTIPSPDNTSNTSYLVIGPSTGALKDNTSSGAGVNFAACVDTLTGSRCAAPSSTCYCATSNQGEKVPTNTINPTSTCDAFGVLNNNLVGYWKMDDNVSDISGSSNNGTLAGAPNTPTYTTGKAGKGVNFAGGIGGDVGDYFTVNNATSLQFPSFTFSLWIYGNQASRFQRLINGGSAFYDFRIHQDNTYQLELWNGSTWSSCTGGTFTTGGWNHVAVTHNSSTNSQQIYVNGSPAGSACTITATPRYGAIYIGGNQTNEGFNGVVDELRIYNRALSPAEVSLLNFNGAGCI